MFKTQNKGFTLVELIVVITILAILWTIAFISLQWYSKDARNSARVSDIKNTEKVLELFALERGKYPVPWNASDVTASWGTVVLWKAWDMDADVQRQVERLSKLPLDPKTGETMKYATTLSRKEYELKYDFELAQNSIINTSYADSNYPYVRWTYNWLYLLADNNIYYSVPWLHTSTNTLDTAVDFEMNNKTVNYQVSPLSYSWVTLTSSNVTDNYVNFWLALKAAYENETDLNDGLYIQVKAIDETTAEVFAVNITQWISVGTPQVAVAENGTCWSDDAWSFTVTPTNLCSAGASSVVTDGWAWNNYAWTCDGLNWWTNDTCSASHENTTYPWCDNEDITFGIYTISACNVWTNIAWTSASSYGDHFQFGRNVTYPTWTNWNVWYTYDWKSPGGADSWSANDWWVYESVKWTATYQNSNSASQTLMQWPCATWYHIPTDVEWNGILVAWGWWSNGTNMMNAIKLPFAGYRGASNAILGGQGSSALYWTATPTDAYSYRFSFNASSISPSTSSYRWDGFSIRCFKN